MADKSLDEIIAAKGLNFKVQFQNQDARKKIQGKVFQQGGQGQNVRQGFPGNKKGVMGTQKRPFSAPSHQQKSAVSGPKQQPNVNIASLAGPGKGQIDARDMISIKNRIKMSDARSKIIQARMQKGSFDARSKLKPKVLQGNPNQQVMVSGGPPPAFQQVKLFQQPGHQLQQPPAFQNQQRPPLFQQPPQQFQELPPPFQQAPPPFQQPPPQFQQPGPQFQQPLVEFEEPLLEYDETELEFQDPGLEFEDPAIQFVENDPDFLELEDQGDFQAPQPAFQNQPPFQQNLPPFQQNQPPFQLNQPRFQQNQPRFQQNQPRFQQNQPRFQQNQPRFQQNQPPFLSNRPPFPQNQPRFQQSQPPLQQNPPPSRPPFQQNRPPFQQRPPAMQQGPPHFQQGPPPPPQLHQQQQQQQQLPPRFQQPSPMQQPMMQQNIDEDVSEFPVRLQSGLYQATTSKSDGNRVSVSTSMSNRPGSVPTLTRTLMNPLAAGGALVEDTGSSLKITRAIPDVTFDGSKLTITRRLPPSDPNQEAFEYEGAGQQRMNMGSDRGPVIQIHNDKFRPQPILPPGAGVRSRPANNPQMGSRALAQPTPSMRQPVTAPAHTPIEPPARTPIQVSSRTAVQAPARTPVRSPKVTVQQSAPDESRYATGNSRYKYSKNPPIATKSETSLESQGRLKPPPAVSEPPRRPAQSALSRIQLHAQTDSVHSRLSSPRQPAMKRLAPLASYPQQPEDPDVSPTMRAGMKRRAPLSLSDRFGAGGGSGNPIPVITDQAVKKRRPPPPEPMEEFVEDYEMKQEQFVEEEEEEDPVPTLLSPLQGFCIMVSNLHTTVTQDDIIELFAAIGPLKRANLLQKGQAEVAFVHRDHAVVALKKYHNRELDGQPMFVKLVTPLNAKVMKPPPSAEENAPALPPSLRLSKKPSEPSAPVDIPLIHKALFKTGSPTPGKSVRFTVKI